MILADNYLGNGLFTLPEAASYARIKQETLIRWMFGKHSFIKPLYGRGGGNYIGFLDFIQAIMIKKLRSKYNVPVRKFREAIRLASENYGMEYPFATRHSSFYDTRLQQLVLCPPGSEKDAELQYVQASGKQQSQTLVQCKVIYEEFFEYGENELVNVYRPFVYKNIPITHRPEYRFGEPMLPSGYTALNIANAIRIEGSDEAVANLYKLPLVEVEAAHNYRVEYLETNAA